MYQDLKLSDRARVIEMAVRSGITDLDTIEQVYNTFAQGGPKEELINRINSTSTANFVQRLKNPNRAFINNPDGTISTHSMAYATAGDKAIVYPEVQEIEGILRRVPSEDALDSAVARGDTLMMSIPEAEWFTANYKDYYPKGNTFDDGGDLEGETPKKKVKFDKPVSWYVSQKPELYQSINKISPEYLDKYFYIDDDGVIRSNLARDKFTRRRAELKNSLGEIGYNQDNEIMLTTDAANARYRTGRISTDLLDYIYDNAARAKIPFKEAVGLAGKESTLGIGRGYKRGQSISPINLYSYWAGIGAGTRSNQQMKKLDQIYKQFYNGEQIDMEALAKAEAEYQKLYDNLHEFQGDNLVKAAYDYYKAGKYNPGEAGYDADVIRQGEAILSDRAVQKWLKTKKAYSGRGFSDGGSLEEALFKRNWELLWGNGRKFEDGGPEGDSGFNAGATLLKRLKRKYLSDYANKGYVYSYPSNPFELFGYAISPYARTSEYGNYMLDVMPENITDARRALFSKNFGVNSDGKGYENAIVESRYRPTVSSNPDTKYYTLPIDDPKTRFEDLQSVIGTAKYDFGEDENGKYISIYDKWDLAPFSDKGNDFPGTTPPEIYDRFYQSEIPEIYSAYSLPGADPSVGYSSGMDFSSGGNLFDGGGDKDGIKKIMALIASGRAPQAVAEAIKNIGSRKAVTKNTVASKLVEHGKNLASAADDAKGVLAYQEDDTTEGLTKSMDRMISLMGKMPEPMRKRAIEVGMRVNSGGTPSNAMKEYKYYGDPIKDAIYITTGIGSPSAKRYSGVVDSSDLLTPEKYSEAIRPDIIDAIVHGKKVNPVIGAQVDSPEGDYGIETDYIRRTYPDRKVQYIETEPPVGLVNQNGIESHGIIPASFSGSFRTSIPDLVINNQGFVGEYGTRNDSTFVRGFDVYDFASNPDDRSGYKRKWGFTPSGTENSSNTLIDIVNTNTNPLVIRTPWVPVDQIGNIITDIRMNPEGKSFTDLPDVVNSIFEITRSNKLGSGGKIHIKPENRGKFTALKKRTGKSASWFKAHGTPAQKKMAVFALNAKKWKHGDGGYLMTKL